MSLLTKISATLQLVRFEHAVMYGISVLIAEIIAAHGMVPFTPVIIFSLLIPIFSEMGAFAMNDLLDIQSDRLNKKLDRPLVSGELSPRFALFLTVVSFLLALFFAYLVSPVIFILALVINILAILYNVVLKDVALLGNIYIAFTMAIPFIFGNYVISDVLSPANILIATLGFIVGLGREIVKTVEDMHGDKKARRAKTLPIIIGAEKSLTLAGILYALFALVAVIPYYRYLNPGLGLAPVLAADAIFLYCSAMLIFSRRKVPFLGVARKLSLFALLLGLIGILMSVLGY
ncbi:Digeranylgeranylglyceryl phosphate synthase [uncultured archaeon]|nr:Digeranylgeranylglyceryl phosphate synthase [uncultured archaeon]